LYKISITFALLLFRTEKQHSCYIALVARVTIWYDVNMSQKLKWDIFTPHILNFRDILTTLYSRVSQIQSWRATVLQTLAQTMIKLTYLLFSKDLDLLVQVCLIKVGTKLCRTVALQDQIWGILLYRLHHTVSCYPASYSSSLTCMKCQMTYIGRGRGKCVKCVNIFKPLFFYRN